MPTKSKFSSPIPIFVAVVAYCAAEVVLLFAVPVVHASWYLDNTLTVLWVFAVAFTVIPGTAALFSLLTTGTHRRWRRAALYFAIPLAATGVFFGVGFLADITDRGIPGLGLVIGLIALGALIMSIVKGWSISRKRALDIETKRFLAHAQTGYDPSSLHSHDRLVARCLWIPSLTVLAVFLFIPETWGIVSHALQPGKAVISGYRFSIPVTWVVAARSEDGLWMHGLVGRGLGRAPRLWLNNGPTRYPWVAPYPVGLWWIAKQKQPSGEWPDDFIIERRHFDAADITCINHISSWQRRDWERSHHSLAGINCSTPDGFTAGFSGDETELPAFYRMMEGVRR